MGPWFTQTMDGVNIYSCFNVLSFRVFYLTMDNEFSVFQGKNTMTFAIILFTREKNKHLWQIKVVCHQFSSGLSLDPNLQQTEVKHGNL